MLWRRCRAPAVRQEDDSLRRGSDSRAGDVFDLLDFARLPMIVENGQILAHVFGVCGARQGKQADIQGEAATGDANGVELPAAAVPRPGGKAAILHEAGPQAGCKFPLRGLH